MSYLLYKAFGILDNKSLKLYTIHCFICISTKLLYNTYIYYKNKCLYTCVGIHTYAYVYKFYNINFS